MKTVKFLFLAIAATFAFAACNKDDDSSDKNDEFYLRAKVDGDDYESATSLLTGYAAFGQVVMGGFESAAGRSFTLNFEENLAVGTYAYNGSVSNNVAAVYYPGGVGSPSYGDISGSFTILEYDTVANTIKGEFEFIAEEPVSLETVSITDGEFSMKYQ